MITYRIHGDNIVECERISKNIIDSLAPYDLKSYLVSPSTITIELKAEYMHNPIEWKLVLLPGFNKNKKRRWQKNIFDPLRKAGSYFDETPDAIITIVENDLEKILLGIEFCSALQAGNQAWQRSARAFSTGRTGCPYIYIVDFVKYELDNKSRKRKNLRFPNAAVPYSYVNYSKITGNFVAQLYVKSEEFDKTRDTNLIDFNEDDFGISELGSYMVKLMLGQDTSEEEQLILSKNMNVVRFLANHFNSKTNFTPEEWRDIYAMDHGDIVDYCVEKDRFGFHKTIAAKSHHGQSGEIIKLVDWLSVGLAARDLPFGIIPSDDRPTFAKRLSVLYPHAAESIISSIGEKGKHLIIAVFKGFKPHGDDNRPDRGLLPLAAMLSNSDIDVLSFIYGPIIEANLELLDNSPIQLAKKNGLWRSILSLSDFVLLDVPVISKDTYGAERLYDTRNIKGYYANIGVGETICPIPAFSSVPVRFGEDDVDTGIHYLFTHILHKICFEGMCNPPGGDWSGFSVIDGDYENRWLSLPRVSDVINGKRPDHILEIFGVFEKPLLLSIESKEKSYDLEHYVGTRLITYIESLMNYIPSSTRRINPETQEWQWGSKRVDIDDFEVMSAAAYLKEFAQPSSVVFMELCEILFVMDPIINDEFIGWKIEIKTCSERGKILKDYIISRYADTGDEQFILV